MDFETKIPRGIMLMSVPTDINTTVSHIDLVANIVSKRSSLFRLKADL